MGALTFVCSLETEKEKTNQNQTFKNGEDLPYFPQICRFLPKLPVLIL